MVPSWITAVNAAPGSSQPSRAGTMRRCPLLEIGRNSREALHDAEHRRLDQFHVTSFPPLARRARLGRPTPKFGALRRHAPASAPISASWSAGGAHEGGDERALSEGRGQRHRRGGSNGDNERVGADLDDRARPGPRARGRR